MAQKYERCDVCKGGHATKKHDVAQKMADHNMQADKKNWEERHKRMFPPIKK